MGAAARAPSRRGNRNSSRKDCMPPVGGRRSRLAPVRACAPGETDTAAAKSDCRCSALCSGRFRFYGTRVSGKPGRPCLRLTPRPAAPRAPPPGSLRGSLAGARGAFGAPTPSGPANTQHGQTVAARRVQPVTTRVCSGYRAGGTGTGKQRAKSCVGPPCRCCRPSGRSSRQSPM